MSVAEAAARFEAVSSSENAAPRPAIDVLAAGRQHVEQLVKRQQAAEEKAKRFEQDLLERLAAGEFSSDAYFEPEDNTSLFLDCTF
jgi:hypothetical protein